MDLARRFDLRFIIMADRYDIEKFSKRSVEDLKERYYKICGLLAKVSVFCKLFFLKCLQLKLFLYICRVEVRRKFIHMMQIMNEGERSSLKDSMIELQNK